MNGKRCVNSDCVENFDDLLVQSVPSPPAGSFLCADSKLRIARPICFRLLAQADRRAASRAACTAGSNKAIRMPMTVMTTRSSTKRESR